MELSSWANAVGANTSTASATANTSINDLRILFLSVLLLNDYSDYSSLTSRRGRGVTGWTKFGNKTIKGRGPNAAKNSEEAQPVGVGSKRAGTPIGSPGPLCLGATVRQGAADGYYGRGKERRRDHMSERDYQAKAEALRRL